MVSSTDNANECNLWWQFFLCFCRIWVNSSCDNSKTKWMPFVAFSFYSIEPNNVNKNCPHEYSINFITTYFSILFSSSINILHKNWKIHQCLEEFHKICHKCLENYHSIRNTNNRCFFIYLFCSSGGKDFLACL